jgi:uncharacterized membrane protein YgcG
MSDGRMGVYMSSTKTKEEQDLYNSRKRGVDRYWAREKTLVQMGMGTRDWTPEQQRELLETGSVSGFQGHHMLSAAAHPEQADNPDNIQPLTTEEHLAAHGNDYKNPTNGRYDPATGTTKEFSDGKIEAPDVIMLSDPVMTKDEAAETSASGEMADYGEKVDAIAASYKSNLRRGMGSRTDPEKLALLDRQIDEKAAAAKANYSSYLASKYNSEEYNNLANYSADRQFMFGDTLQTSETGQNHGQEGNTGNAGAGSNTSGNENEGSGNDGSGNNGGGSSGGGNNGSSNDDGMEM